MLADSVRQQRASRQGDRHPGRAHLRAQDSRDLTEAVDSAEVGVDARLQSLRVGTVAESVERAAVLGCCAQHPPKFGGCCTHQFGE